MADNSIPTSLLHGAYNLTDLLGELPVAEPAPESLHNQHILFDPRLGEDVRRILNNDGRNDMNLISRLCMALGQIDSSSIQPSVASSENLPPVNELPPLIQAVLSVNPALFQGPQAAANHHSPSRRMRVPTGSSEHNLQASQNAPEQNIQNQSRNHPSSSSNVHQPPASVEKSSIDAVKLETTSWHAQEVPEVVRHGQPNATTDRVPPPHLSTSSVTDDALAKEKIKKKKKKELDQLEQNNRNLAKYDNRYPDAQTTSTTPIIEDPDMVDDLVDKFSTVTKDRAKRKRGTGSDMSQAQRVSASLSVMAEQGLPPINPEFADIDTAGMEAGTAGDQPDNNKNSAAKIKKRKRDKEDNDRLTVRLQLSLVGGNDDLIENVVYRNFVQLMEDILQKVEDADMTDFLRKQKLEDDAPCEQDVPEEIVISRGLLSELVSEASKLCELGATCHIGAEGLSRILTILQWNVKYGGQCLLSKGEEEEQLEREQALWREVAAGRVLHSIDSCLAILYVLTAPGLPRQLYTDEVIEAVVGAVRFQLHNTIFPEYDPLYRTDAEGKSYGNLKTKRSRSGHVKDKSVVSIYQKIMLTIDLLANLVTMQDLGDTILIKLTSIAVAPFFVENISEVQLAALRLVVAMFAKHERIRQFILDDVLSSLTKLPSTKRNLRSYRLWNHSGSIQMVTALVLNIVQCMAKLPTRQQASESTLPSSEDQAKDEQQQSQPDASTVLQSSYELARKTAHLFIAAFFKKCTQKSEDDYRPLFENFVQDLLTTAQRPEWPATDLMLTLLGSILMQQFTNRQLDNNIRTAALDYFGQIAARLRRDSMNAAVSKEALDQVVDQLKEMGPDYAGIFEKKYDVDDEDDREVVDDVESNNPKRRRKTTTTTTTKRKSKSPDVSVVPSVKTRRNQKEKKKEQKAPVLDENTRLLQLMQKAFSCFLLDASSLDPTLAYARNFCIAQWHADAGTEAERAIKIHTAAVKSGTETTDNVEDIQSRCEAQKKFVRTIISSERSSTGGNTIKVVSHDTACIVALWLGKQRSYAQSFDYFLNNILNLLGEQTIAIRTRAMKSLALVVESDPAVLNIVAVRKSVHSCLGDTSTSVREAVVDLIGRFILHNADLTISYYPLLCERINDVGVSVRKRVLKIFRDICLEQPDFPKIADLCKQMITRIGDEDSIRKLVSEAFQHMWFQPLDAVKEPHRLIRRVTSIVDVVSACREVGYEWFSQLLDTLLKKSDETVQMTTVETSKQIVDGLVEHTVRCEEVDAETRASSASSSSLVSTLTALSIFCKAAPNLLVPHVQLLHPYLNIKCSTQGDYVVIINTCKILELAVPLMANPNPEFVRQLESDLFVIAMRQGMMVLENAIACLGAVVNRVTQRYDVVISFLEKFTAGLHTFLSNHRKNPTAEIPRPTKAALLRNLYLIGLLCKNFDFEALQHDKGSSVRDTILQYYLYFCVIGDEDIKQKALMGLGFFCTRYFDCLLTDQLRQMYQSLLSDPNASAKFKVQILNNILAGLKEQEATSLDENSQSLANPSSPVASTSMSKSHVDQHGQQHPDDLKEMFDIQSGLASNVTQLYLTNILNAYFDNNVEVRSAAADVILLIVAHGLIHPAKCVPYLIAATTDVNVSIRTRAEQRLRDIEKRYPNFISMKALPGARKSFELQRIIQKDSDEPIRGLFANFKDPSDTNSTADSSPATLAAIYSLLRGNKQHRRVFLVSLIKLFDESSGASLAELVYLADNVVFLPFGTTDEVLHTINQIEQHISISGTNLIQAVKDICASAASGPNGSYANYMGQDGGGEYYGGQPIPEDEEEFFQAQHLLSILPADLTQVHSLVTTTAQNCLLLLSVKNALKEEYGFTDAKVRQYINTCTNKVAQKLYDKPPPRRQVIRYAPSQLDTLRSGPPPVPKIGDVRGRQNLVGQLVEFKQLLDSLDHDAIAAASGEGGGEGEDGIDCEEGMEGEMGEGEGDGGGMDKPKKGPKTNRTPKRSGRGGARGSSGRARGRPRGSGKGRKSKGRGGGGGGTFDEGSDFEDLDEWGDVLDLDDDQDYRP